MMLTTTVMCARCHEPIDTAEGYIVAGDDLQFTDLADPRLEAHEEAMHFVCPPR
jgi:hypothetical protein